MKLSDLKVGDVIVAGSGFTCIQEGRECLVKANCAGELYVDCCGPEDDRSDYGCYHGLDGQEDADGELIGFAWPENRAAA
ncbi:MAG TPA: hypothetical protein VKR31_10295 [Rhizomicrobium sp.]|nr:hypothetical protein [Rhizomicrobium sp.]